ncbi:hypothetical protein LCGC14_0258990 [marine sediment metagenome]|uniref:Uncharacterized protein n=1 Tax=marine sediment metagenome TaxID=412755 RepID=A0A0F9U764_9ZZZZ
MNDCIDRRTGDAETFLCDDANQAYRRARDADGWRRAYEAAVVVVRYLNRDQRRIKRGREWAEQAMDCLKNAAAAAGRKSDV